MYRYIIVDDEVLTRKGTIKKLESLESLITCIGEAENGESGLELIRNFHPDIVITDMNMPIQDGTTFLKNIRELDNNIQIIVISGYKDFNYAKQALNAKALNYLLKPFSKQDIQIAMNEAIRHINTKQSANDHLQTMETEREYIQYDYDLQMLKNLILGYQTEHTLSSSKLKTMCKLHHIVLLTIHSTTELNEAELKDYTISNGFGDLGLYIPHLHNSKIGFYILFFPDHTPLKLVEVCKQISSGLIQLLTQKNSCVSIGISNTKNDLLQLNAAFNECVDALNSQQLLKVNQFSFYSEIKNTQRRLYWDISDEFLFRIESAEVEKVGQLIDSLFQYFTTITECTLFDAKYYCNELIQQTKIILNSYYNNSTSQNNSSSIQNIFNSLFDISELKEYLKVLFQNISASMSVSSIYQIDDTVEKMKLYIDRHYRNNISMEFLSSLFYMNRSYCSFLFKEKTGIKYVDYLNYVRIAKAKELLAKTDTKIYQISKSVGYDNIKYFFRIFKKFTGLTPDEFRKEISTNKTT